MAASLAGCHVTVPYHLQATSCHRDGHPPAPARGHLRCMPPVISSMISHKTGIIMILPVTMIHLEPWQRSISSVGPSISVYYDIEIETFDIERYYMTFDIETSGTLRYMISYMISCNYDIAYDIICFK